MGSTTTQSVWGEDGYFTKSDKGKTVCEETSKLKLRIRQDQPCKEVASGMDMPVREAEPL